MILDAQQTKLLSRIASDSAGRGDGAAFLELLRTLEIDALENSVVPDDSISRWMQGKAVAYKELRKDFQDSIK